MTSFLFDVLSNLVANVAFWGLLGFTFWGLSRGTRARVVRFLSHGESSHVTVMLSNLWRPETSRRKVGFTISRHELQASQAISTFLGKAPGRLPDIVRGLVDQLWLRSRIQCTVDVSPPELNAIEHAGTIIVVGSASRNSYRRYYVTHDVPAAVLDNEQEIGSGISADMVRQVVIKRANGDRQLVQSEQGIAVVEKTHIPGQLTGLFFCYGARAEGTWIAAEYLVRNWRSLEREFGDGPFVACLGFPLGDRYADNYSAPAILTRIRP